MENKKKFVSSIIGAGTCTILFTGIGIWGLFTQKSNSLIPLTIGILSLLCLIYLLNKTRKNKNERYLDERKSFISEKSSSTSYHILTFGIITFHILVSNSKINITANLALSIIVVSAIVIKFVTYFIYKYKY